jgi:oligopeptide transport system substrate-binding protein
MQRLRAVLRRAALLCTVLMLIPLVTATAAPARQESDAVILRVAMPVITNLDPEQLSRFDAHTRDVVENLFVGLTRLNPQTGQIEPMLAQEWTVSEDGLRWTFTLREDMYWMEYDPATQSAVASRQIVAGDVVYAIQRACDPLRPSPVTANLMAIQGCHTLANAFPEVIDDIFIAREMGIRATGPHTLEIDLLYPASYFPTLLSLPELRPLPRETLAATQELVRGARLMTSGPFIVQRWDSSGMTLAHNPQWPEPLAGNATEVNITFTNEPTGMVSTNAVDFARLSETQTAAAYATLPDLLHTAEGRSLLMLGFSYERAVVDTPEARRALSLALDRTALVNQFFPAQMLPAAQFTPENVIAAPTPTTSLYNIDEARTLFGIAGYPGCDNMPEPLILLVPDDDPVWVEVGTAITQQWMTVFGCNSALFEVKPVSRTLLIELSHANYDPEEVVRSHMWLFTWNADYPDANAWTSDALHCRFGYIRNGRPCTQADAQMDKAGTALDLAERTQYYNEIENLLFGPNGTYPVVPIMHSAAGWLQQLWLTDVDAAHPARYDLWQIDTARAP